MGSGASTPPLTYRNAVTPRRHLLFIYQIVVYHGLNSLVPRGEETWGSDLSLQEEPQKVSPGMESKHRGSGRQENQKVRPSLCYILSWRPAWATQDLISRNKNKSKQWGGGRTHSRELRAINQYLEDQGVQVGLGQVLASPGKILALVRFVA